MYSVFGVCVCIEQSMSTSKLPWNLYALCHVSVEKNLICFHRMRKNDGGDDDDNVRNDVEVGYWII